jgi:ketosteroid isomerase-like protein
MSQENVEIVRRSLEALARRDTDAMGALVREHLAPDFEFESAMTGRTYRGASEVWDLAADLWDTLDYALAVEEVIDLGDRVVAVLRISGRGARSGAPVSQRVAILWTFEDNRVVRGKSFTSRDEALQATGLRE